MISLGVKICPLWGLALSVADFLCLDDRFIIREIWSDCRGISVGIGRRHGRKNPPDRLDREGKLNSVPIENEEMRSGPVDANNLWKKPVLVQR